MSNDRDQGRHYCDYADCGKSFRRAEHLTRHKLNHSQPTILCPHCDHQFYRNDLLQRHLTLRHKSRSKGRSALRVNGHHDSSVSPHDSSHGAIAQNGFHVQSVPQIPNTEQPLDDIVTMNFQVGQSAVEQVYSPLPEELFGFPSGDLSQLHSLDWPQYGHVYDFPIDPPVDLQVDGSTSSHSIPYDGEWHDPAILQELAISQQVYASLTSLRPVIDSGCDFTLPDTIDLLHSAFNCITDSLPIFHRPTFSFDRIYHEIHASIFCLGLLISPIPLHFDIGCSLLHHLHEQLLTHVQHNTIYRTDLWLLQTMLLLEFCGTFYADRPALELSDIFHGTLVTLCRRLNIFESAPVETTDPTLPQGESEGRWHSWIEDESRKRIAYYVFSLDVQHALYFGHKRMIMSPFVIKLEIPCDDADWQAPHSTWLFHHRTHTRRLQFPEIQQALLSRDESRVSSLPKTNSLSNLLILLGLASIVLDFLQRHKEPFYNTKDALRRLSLVLPVVNSRLTGGHDDSVKTHGQTVYHISVIALCIPLEDLEAAANNGFSRSGRTPEHQTRDAIIRLLTRYKVKSETARHAIHLLKLYLTALPLSNGASGTVKRGYSPYETSALYFASLTLWAYVIGRVSDEDEMQITEDMDNSAATDPANEAPLVGQLLQAADTAIETGDISQCRQHWQNIVQHVVARLSSRPNSNAQEYSQVLRSLSRSVSV